MMNIVMTLSIFLLGLLSLASGTYIARPQCNDTISEKSINLVSPMLISGDNCVYYIKPHSNNVCQMRIDFAMTLAQPTRNSSNTFVNSIECLNDYFRIGDMKLCGSETNQHIYLTLSEESKEMGIEIEFVIAKRMGATLPKPYWDMIITQLECEAQAEITPSNFLIENIENIVELAHHNQHMKKMAIASVTNDFTLAPAGCLQYFSDSHGYVSSFNYNNGRGIYPGQMNYAICFRRTAETTALE